MVWGALVLMAWRACISVKVQVKLKNVLYNFLFCNFFSLSSVSNQEVQSPEFVSVEAGKSVSISCTGTSGVGDDMSWYLQKPGEAPKLLIHDASTRWSGVPERFSGSYSLT